MKSNLVDGYFYSYNSDGVLECVNHSQTGATVWVKDSPEYTAETNELTAKFLATNPDLSNQPIEEAVGNE